MSYEDINVYGKRVVRKKDIVKLQGMIELPEMPDDVEDKTYVLKIVNGKLQWVEEE